MTFPGKFRDHILEDRLESLSLSFLVDTLVRRSGGIAANIAYTLALLGERPKVMATVGEDFEEYRAHLEHKGVDTEFIKTIPGLYTASFFVTTDEVNSQFASFYTGAMARASDLRLSDLPVKPDLVMISPNDPEAMIGYAQECAENGIPFLYDPSQQIVRLPSEDLRLGIEKSLALFANDYELGMIQEKTALSMDDIVSMSDFTIITRGQDGATLYFDQESTRIPVVTPNRTLDPTGVGDAFRGGFLKGYLNALDLHTCGRMGALAATWCLENDGPQGHEYTLDEFVTRFVQLFPEAADVRSLP
jgi:adenosine kinase